MIDVFFSFFFSLYPSPSTLDPIFSAFSLFPKPYTLDPRPFLRRCS